MEIELLPATESDAEELVLLRIAAMRESLERIGRFDPIRVRERFLAGFSVLDTLHIMSGGTRVGFLVLKRTLDGFLLDHLYVHPTQQGLGIGAWVLQWIFYQADSQGEVVRVGALKGSDSNRFYIRHGFNLVEVAEWDNYYVRIPNCITKTML